MRVRKDGYVISGGAADAEREASEMSEPVVQELLDALLGATWRSGERVKEVTLARRLEISRRALRGALRVLDADGLLEALPDGGVAVPHVDINTVLDLYAVRSALGTLLFRRAAVLHSSELHQVRAALGEVRAIAKKHAHDRIGGGDLHFQDMIARTADMPQASLFFQQLTLRLRMFITVLGLDFADGAVDLIAREDGLIFDALREGDGEEAARLWRVKVERSVRYMAAQLPDENFDPHLWTTLAGAPERRAGDPRQAKPVNRLAQAQASTGA
ncbi:GntR family transcriptional regulator [Streptomyces sp. NPDC055400]